jgi:hypothetical protein
LKAFDISLTSMPLNALGSATNATYGSTAFSYGTQFLSQGTGAAGLLLLNGIIPGPDFNQRVGRQVLMKSLEILLAVVPVNNSVTSSSNGTAAPSNPPWFDFGRIMILYDRQINSSTYGTTIGATIGAAAGLSILQNVVQVNSTTIATTSWGQDFINLDFRERWGVLKDWRMLLPTYVGNQSNQPFPSASNLLERTETTFFRKYFLKLGGLEVQFNGGATGTSADINTGALWLFTCGALQSTGQYRVLVVSRLRYWDA